MNTKTIKTFTCNHFIYVGCKLWCAIGAYCFIDIVRARIVARRHCLRCCNLYNGAEGPQGFEYELLAGFADFLGVTLDLYPFYSYDVMLEQLEEGNLDIVATGDAITPLLAKRFDYGPAYQHVEQLLIYQAGTTRPRDLEQLDKPIITVSGSSQTQLLEERLNLAPHFNHPND